MREGILTTRPAAADAENWPEPDSDLARAVRLAIADLVVCLVWEAVWPPDEELPPDEAAGGDAESSAPDAPL